MISKDFIIGGDPEFFCKNIETEQYISLIPYIAGTKKRPETINIKGCSQLRDGTAIELNLPPVPEFWMLHKIISDCIEYTNNWLKELNPSYKLDITSSAHFNNDELLHKEARVFGCQPAYNAYTSKEVFRPDPDDLNGLRTASYHIHYGWDHDISVVDLKKFIFLNDIFLGFPALFLDKTDVLRKQVYGSLGEHRIKKSKLHYTEITECNRVEYRTLGAGMHEFPGFIENGIKLIRENLENIDTFVELYYNDLAELSMNLDSKLIAELKTKLIKNRHYNG